MIVILAISIWSRTVLHIGICTITISRLPTISAMATLITKVFIVKCLICGYQFSTFSEMSSRRSCIRFVKSKRCVISVVPFYMHATSTTLLNLWVLKYHEYHHNLLILAIHVFDSFLFCVFEASLQCSDTTLHLQLRNQTMGMSISWIHSHTSPAFFLLFFFFLPPPSFIDCSRLLICACAAPCSVAGGLLASIDNLRIFPASCRAF